MAERKTLTDRVVEWLGRRIPVEPRELLSMLTFTGLLYGPVDERLHIRDALQKMLRKPVPKHVNWTFCFGGITMLLFMVQAFTGILLALYYKPSPQAAYESVQHIMNNVRMGWLIRQIHAWGANLMILMLFLHMMRVFLYGAYKSPREMNWMAGVILLFLTLMFAFTGYLLPWDQLAFWAVTVGTEITASFPIVGKYILMIARGGENVTGDTLARFFALHVIVLPVATGALMAIHLFMVRRQGISGPL
ncbi:MAG: cytochrome bc complex cytochrome b subunit [Candidatus Poribacteria bacterium]